VKTKKVKHQGQKRPSRDSIRSAALGVLKASKIGDDGLECRDAAALERLVVAVKRAVK
jgi:hypothetical protein